MNCQIEYTSGDSADVKPCGKRAMPVCVLKTTEDLFDNRSSPKTESMVAAAVQWADKIMRKIDNVFG
jgi:hypothetical protein